MEIGGVSRFYFWKKETSRASQFTKEKEKTKKISFFSLMIYK
jgi:hypothetical protein